VKNLGINDRLLRGIVAEIFIIAAFFWRGGEWQLLLYLVAAMFIIQAVSGNCGLYNLLGWNTCEKIKRKNTKLVTASLILMVVVATVGSIASAIVTKNIFLDDLDRVEGPYNTALSYTGQNMQAESVESIGLLKASFASFEDKYSRYRPLVVKFDGQLTEDLNNLSSIFNSSEENIIRGDLASAHSNLKEAEPVLSSLKERNGLT
jgi:hypothetical protein